MNMRWLLRAYRWVRNSPSPRTVKLILALIAALLALAAVEHFIGWPDALTPSGDPRGRVPRL